MRRITRLPRDLRSFLPRRHRVRRSNGCNSGILNSARASAREHLASADSARARNTEFSHGIEKIHSKPRRQREINIDLDSWIYDLPGRNSTPFDLDRSITARLAKRVYIRRFENTETIPILIQ